MRFETIRARKSVRLRAARLGQALRFHAALAACREGIVPAAADELLRKRSGIRDSARSIALTAVGLAFARKAG
jgi:hypothetical protein